MTMNSKTQTLLTAVFVSILAGCATSEDQGASVSNSASKVGDYFKTLASNVSKSLTTAPSTSTESKPAVDVGPQAQGPIVYKGSLLAFSQERNKNDLRFGDRYKGKVVILSGYMMDVSDHESGRQQEQGGVSGRAMSALRFTAIPGRNGLKNALGMCYAEDPASRKIIRSLDQGQKVTVRAIYDYDSSRADLYYDLSECVVVSVAK